MDLYRLKSPEEAEAIGFAEVFADDGVTAVEWADRFPSLLPSDRLEIRLAHRTVATRSVQFVAQGEGSRALLARIMTVLPSAKRSGRLQQSGLNGKRKASPR
jgi:tRNA threonylcarbamoyladenosine biosynthesis protein TsaE